MKTSISIVIIIPVLICSCREASKHDDRSQADNSRGDVSFAARHSGTEPRIRTLDQIPLDQLRVLLKGYSGDWRKQTDHAKGVPPPSIQKPYPEDAKLVDLTRPENIRVGSMPLAEVIDQRRSRRTYTDGFLSNEELSFLLWSTQGISRIVRNEEREITHHFRTVPSGGARHPFETYLVINMVEGISPGIYRYLAVEHKLLPTRKEEHLSQAIEDACYGQEHVGDAAAVFIWSAIPYRTEWRYGCIAHRMIAMEAGHVCQNLYLAAESIGGGACAILGYDQESLDKLIDVDGKDEFTIYLASVGKIDNE